MDDDYLEGRREPKAFESIYNVIWVVRIGEVAYRKATGMVYADIWETYSTEEVDITMG